ncbi:hypothetical protein [Fluviicola sp.]|uniref:hypothetical protein n=1 Tax=Fluviicola sp. TaxID=1917219 RepID=UPI0031DAE79D
MKTIFSLAILATLALTSCKKEYTCACTVTVHQPEFSYQGQVYQEENTTTSSSSTTIKDKKDDAKSTCEAGSAKTSTPSPYAQAGAEPTTTTTTCAIK